MPRDTAWIEDIVSVRPQPITNDLRQVDFAEAGLCDLPRFEPKSPKVEDVTQLHRLLKAACDDFASVLLDPRYRIAVGSEWHTPEPGTFVDRCAVCVAGAVIAKTFKQSRTASLWPEEFSPEIEARLVAIDQLRLGNVSEALSIMNPYADGEALKAASALTDFWTRHLYGVADASNRINGFLLLLELRSMQEELKAANL